VLVRSRLSESPLILKAELEDSPTSISLTMKVPKRLLKRAELNSMEEPLELTSAVDKETVAPVVLVADVLTTEEVEEVITVKVDTVAVNNVKVVTVVVNNVKVDTVAVNNVKVDTVVVEVVPEVAAEDLVALEEEEVVPEEAPEVIADLLKEEKAPNKWLLSTTKKTNSDNDKFERLQLKGDIRCVKVFIYVNVVLRV